MNLRERLRKLLFKNYCKTCPVMDMKTMVEGFDKIDAFQKFYDKEAHQFADALKEFGKFESKHM